MREGKSFIRLSRMTICLTLAIALFAVVSIAPVFADISFNEQGANSIGHSVNDTATGDFNNDGNIDIIVISTYDKYIGLFKGTGTGAFDAISSINTASLSYNPLKVAAGDFNGDGNLDFAVTLEYGYNISVYYGNGDGNFSGPTLFPFSNSKALGIASGDFNGDGHTDIVLGDQETLSSHQHFQMLTNNGSGGFTASGNIPNGGALYAFKLVAEDFDEDGNTDIAFLGDGSGTSFNGSFSMVYGDGAGGFGNGWSCNINKAATHDMDIADINDDGLLDIIFAKSHTGTGATFISTLTNQGGKTAFTLNEFNSISVYVDNFGIAAEDFNGDYEMDAVAAGENKVRFWLGISDYAFSESPDTYITAANNPKVLTSADFDKDGKVDIAAVNSTNNTLCVYLNNCNFGPFVNAISDTKIGTEDQLDISINAADMYAGYSDKESNSFGGIKITRLPVGGVLKLGESAAIIEGQTFSPSELDGKAFVYNPNDNWHGDTFLEWRPLDDQGSVGITRRVNISIASVIDAPFNIVPAAQAVLEDTPLVFSTAGGNAIQVSDPDVEAAELLEASITTAQGTVTLNGTAALTFTIGDGSEDSSMTFTGTLANINTALNGLTFYPTADYSGAATITINTNDQGNGGAGSTLSDEDTVNITVNFVNDAPLFTKGSDVTVNEDSGAQTVSGWATGISGGPGSDSGQNTAFIIVNNTNPGLFSTGPAIDTYYGNLTFTPAANANGSAAVTVRLADDQGTVNGGQNMSDPQTFNITINAINDAPANIAPASQSVNEDTTLVFSTANANAIQVSDPDAGASLIEVTLTATEGVLTLNGTMGLSFGAGDGSGDSTMTLTGTLSNINVALNGLAFAPTAEYSGGASISINANDQGNTGAGGAFTDTDSINITVNIVNDAPSFAKGADQSVIEDCGAQTVSGWATGITAGPLNESGQTLGFIVTNDNNGLFAIQPAVDTNGTLTYTPAANANGSAAVTVSLTDNGGTANGGTDTTAAQTFIITVSSVNDASSFTKGADQIVNEDCSAQTVSGWATGITAGPPNESGQTLEFIVTNDNNGLFSVQPTVAADGTLTYIPAADANGSATVTVVLTDNGGVDTTPPQTFTIIVSSVNDAPSFTKGADQIVNEDSGAQTAAGWATGITAGPPNESEQILEFIVNNDNNGLFSVQPAVEADGTLTYTPAADANGSATVTLYLSDNGDTDNGGADTTTPQIFIITVNSVNDAPSFTKGADQIVNKDCGAQTAAGWATGITAGPPNESGQTLEFIATNDNSGLFAVQPAVDINGTLTYTVAENTSGIAEVSVKLKDNGGGMDTSAEQTFIVKVCASSGSGEITLSQDTFTAGKTGSTITFTYTAASGGMEDGKLTIEVPDEWSSPSTVPTANGYTTASNGIVSISGRILLISDITVSSGDTISVTYGDKNGGGPGATASTVKGLYEWTVKSAAMADGSLSSLVNPPKIRILPDITSATRSSILAGDNEIPADGQTTTIITVVLTDDHGNTIGDHTVSLSQGSGASTIIPASIDTDSDGKAVFTINSLSAGTVTYTAKDNTDNIIISERAVVTFKPGIKYTKAAVNIEEGEAAEYSVSLVSCPDSEVTVTAEVYGELEVSPVELIFDADNWSIEQIFTLTAEDNSSKDGNRLQTVANSVYSSDSLYDGLDFDITVNILDNDTPGVTIIQSSGYTEVGEGGSEDSYTVKLLTRPKDDVIVSVNTDNQLTVEPMEIIFTTASWNIAQELIVTAVDDNMIEGAHTSTISHTISSSDNDYDDIDISEITVTIADNDFPDNPSDDASLKSLEISQGALTPGFDPAITKYDANVNNNIGSITITPTASESHGTITVNGTAVASGTASYPITLSVGENTINVKITAQDGVTTETYVVYVVRASKRSNNDNDSPRSGGSSNAGKSDTPKENESIQQPKINLDGSVSITVSPKPDSNNGTAAASLDADTLENAFGMAETGTYGVRTVIFNIPGVEGANAYNCNLPKSFLNSGDNSRAVEIKTDIASVAVPGNMLLQENSEGSQSISLIIAMADKSKLDADAQNQIGDRPAVELYLKINGIKIPWSNNNAPVTVTIPYTPTAEELNDPEHIAVWYIDSSGNVVSVPSGRYDPATGRVSFSTTHFSQYAVAYVQRIFSDIGGYAWARNQIEVLASKGIVNGTSEKTFSPQVNISRADYIVMLVKALGLTADFDSNFVDVKPGDYYYEAAGIAKELGIAAGDSNNYFKPKDNISRQDMMVLTARALEESRKLKPAETYEILDEFNDKEGVAGYALKSVATLVAENLISGSEGRINHSGQTTRAEAAVLLYRIYNSYPH